MRNVSDKICTEIKNTNFTFSSLFFFENRPVYEIMWKNMVELDRTQMTVWRMRAINAGYLRLQTHIQNMQYLLLSTTTMFARTRLYFTLYAHCLSSFLKINLTLFYRRVSNCRPPANRQPSLLLEVFLTQDRASALNCWQIILECIPSFLVIDLECSHKL
jgi:hypothetical protein